MNELFDPIARKEAAAVLGWCMCIEPNMFWAEVAPWTLLENPPEKVAMEAGLGLMSVTNCESCVVNPEAPSFMAAFRFRVWMFVFFRDIGLSTWKLLLQFNKKEINYLLALWSSIYRPEIICKFYNASGQFWRVWKSKAISLSENYQGCLGGWVVRPKLPPIKPYSSGHHGHFALN